MKGDKLSFYEKNNLHLEVDHSDPAATSTNIAVLDYMNRAAELTERTWDEDNAGHERPLREDYIFVTCDNSPQSIWWGIRNRDVQSHLDDPSQRKYGRFRYVIGPFHAESAFLCSRGNLSRQVVTPFICRYRTTEARVNWVLTPHDPTDAKNENIEYILAHYEAAISACRVSLNRDDVSARDVHNYMLERAKKYPTVMAILLDLRMVTIDFMIRDTEKAGDRGDLDLFLSSMRLSLIFFACTNCRKYVRTVCEFLEWYHCASTAEKELFKQYYFCKTTANGRPIWGDRGVEKTMLHIRHFMGRYARPSHDNILEKVINDIPFRQESMRSLRDLLGVEKAKAYTSMPWNDQYRNVGKVYAHIRVACEDWNVWGGGSPVSSGLDIGGAQETRLPDGSYLSNTYLSAKSIGEQRVLDFYETHLVKTRYPVKIPTKEVSLRMLPTSKVIRVADMESLRALRLSTDEKDFNSKKMQDLLSRQKLAEDIEWYRDVYYDVPDDILTSGGKVKQDYRRPMLVKLLCKFRKRYFNDFPEALEGYELQLQQLEWDDLVSSENDRAEELKDDFYALDPTVLAQFG